jgi:hypothetical protein
MSENYLVIFNSQGQNVLNATSLTSVIYNVNWTSFLPKKYKRFKCKFVFKSIDANSILTDNGFVNMNTGKINVFSGEQMTSNIGIIYPVITNTTTGNLRSYYNSTNNDNNDFTMSYPTINQITLSLKTFAGTDMANMPHYTLILSLVGVNDDELDN